MEIDLSCLEASHAFRIALQAPDYHSMSFMTARSSMTKTNLKWHVAWQPYSNCLEGSYVPITELQALNYLLYLCITGYCEQQSLIIKQPQPLYHRQLVGSISRKEAKLLTVPAFPYKL